MPAKVTDELREECETLRMLIQDHRVEATDEVIPDAEETEVTHGPENVTNRFLSGLRVSPS